MKVKPDKIILTLLIGCMLSCNTRKIKSRVQKLNAGKIETRKVYTVPGADDSYLFGRIREFDIPAPLPGLVTINGKQLLTDNAGAFFMRVPIGKSHIEAKAIGYKNFIFNVVVAKGDELEINIYLKDSKDEPPLNCF